MLHFLAFLCIVFIALLLLGVLIIGQAFRKVFGQRRTSGNAPAGDNHRRQPTYTYNADSGQWQRTASAGTDNVITPEEGELHPRRKKIFDKEDGEYVDFEEVKDQPV